MCSGVRGTGSRAVGAADGACIVRSSSSAGVGRAGLPAGELCPSCKRPVRLERLEAEVAAGPHDRGRSVDEPRTLLNSDGLLRDIELEPVDRFVDCGISVLRETLDGGGGHAEAPEVGGQFPPLQFSFGGVLRPIALTVGLWNRPDLLLG
jgi:hypothetical protein